MSLQDSTFNTTHVMDNEIVKANDFEFAFENLIENVAKSTQMMLESTQDFVINGKVVPYSGMNVKVSPIYGVCKSSGIPFGRTELSESIGFEESTSGRVDIIQVKGEWETYDNQQRAFNDPDTDTQTYQYVDTKKLMKPVYMVKKGAEGSSIAPDVDSGYVKLAEVVIRANNSTITADDIKNITSDVAGLDNDDWTAQKDITYNIGYISDVNARFRVQHEADGTHSENCINSDALDIGTGVKQINGNILPVGGSVSIPTQTISATDSILSVITKTASMITSLYNAYLKFGNYKFNGELSISAIADANNDLTNPLKLIAAGDGTAELKIGNSTVLSIDTNGKLSTNGYTASSNNHLITKAVTDAISTALNNLTIRVQQIEETSDVTLYTNGVLSSGTGGRFNIDSASIYAATTQNITLSGSQSIDGQTLSDGVYVLVKDQTDATENGIYQYSSSSAWGRVSSFATPDLIKGKIFNVLNGTANKGKMFYIAKVNFVDSSAFGTDDINFLEYFGSISPIGNKVAVRDSSGNINASVTSAGKLTTARKVYVKLGTASTSETKDFSGDTAIPVDGTLPVANGGTGMTTASYKNAVVVGNSSTATDALRTIRTANGAFYATEQDGAPTFGVLPISQGGTGKTTAADARTNLGLGSAATKTAGSAAGNVSLVGTALGTTNNNIVVTDTNGALKPSGTTIGSAAGKTAGSAAGNVPLIGSAFNSGGVVITDSNSQLKTSSYSVENIIRNGNLSFVCSTDIDKSAKTISITGALSYLPTGFTCRVMFTNGNNSVNPTLAIGSISAKAIKVVRGGVKYSLSNVESSTTIKANKKGYWRGAGSVSTEMWQANTILDLMYDGTDWVIIGNPVVENYYSSTSSYEVYANGLIKQWGSSTSTSTSVKVTFPVVFSNAIYFACTSPGQSVTSTTWNPSAVRAWVIAKDEAYAYFGCDTGFAWNAVGY